MTFSRGDPTWRTDTISELAALGTDEGVGIGDLSDSTGVGESGLYECTGVAASTSTWVRRTNIPNVFDNIGAPEVTPSAAGSGGTAIGSIDLGFGTSSPPMGLFLVVDANTNPMGNTTFEFFADVGLTRTVYQALDKPLDTTVTHTDGTPFYLADLTGSLAASNLLHYRVTNNGSVASTYDIHLRATDG